MEKRINFGIKKKYTRDILVVILYYPLNLILTGLIYKMYCSVTFNSSSLRFIDSSCFWML